MSAGPADRGSVGVTIAGTGSSLPERVLRNADLERMMETSDEWISQRTGVKERRVADASKGESTYTLAADAVERALADARTAASDLDLLICATVCPEMSCPSVACRVADRIGMGTGGAFDITAACSGFVYGLNIAHEMIRSGVYSRVGVVGAETLTRLMEYSDRGRATAIIFGDAAGAAILRATDDPGKGVLAQTMRSDGARWRDLYIPTSDEDHPEGTDTSDKPLGVMQMNGRAVFRFAVSTFSDIIQETLESAGVGADEVDVYVCHQSNVRILDAARERFGIREDKMYVNIDRVGNTSAASIPLCLDELRAAGRAGEGSKVMFVAFGGGLTWASSLWQM